VTTCSPRNFDLVKSLGATHVYDYNAADISERIRKEVPNIKYVFDTIGNEQNSSGISANAANPDSILCTVRPALVNTEGVPDSVKRVDVMIWTAFLKVVKYKGHEWPVSPRIECLFCGFYLPSYRKALT
jgi:NADPH:quinone reductase-like Zn-dependent oxidoreductase